MFIENLSVMATYGFFAGLIVLYIGPETFMPVLSAIAAAAGVILMFWRNLVSMVKKLFRGKSSMAQEDEITKE